MARSGQTTKRKRIWVSVVVVLLVLAACFFGGYYLLKSKTVQINPLFVSANDVIGVDVSHYQAEIDMNALADQGISFVYVKATEGTGYTDPNFPVNWANAKTSALEAGAYHFFSFDSPGKDQAWHYIDVVGSLDGELVPVVDVEWYADKKQNPPARADVERELASFLQVLETHYGVRPMIYTSRDVYDLLLSGSFDEYPLWVCSTILPAWLEWGDMWTMWQYNDRARLAGYSGGEVYIDLNVIAGGRSGLDSLKVS